MVCVLMGEEYLRHLLGLIAESRKSLYIAAYILACVDGTVLVGSLFGSACGNSRINENDLIACVDKIVLQTSAIADILVELVCAFLTAMTKGCP